MLANLGTPPTQETKINKVLKMITKLITIPLDDTYHIRERAIALLEKVNALLAAEPEEEVAAPPPSSSSLLPKDEGEKGMNGNGKEDRGDRDEEMKDVGGEVKGEEGDAAAAAAALKGGEAPEEAAAGEGEGEKEAEGGAGAGAEGDAVVGGAEAKEESKGEQKEKDSDGDEAMAGADDA